MRFALACALIALPVIPAVAANEDLSSVRKGEAKSANTALPRQLSGEERDAYRAVFAAIRAKAWAEAAKKLDDMKQGPLHDVARSELYLAKGSPKVETPALMTLLVSAPELPEADKIAAIARKRGAIEIPSFPQEQRMIWLGGKPSRARTATTKGDTAGAALGAKIMPLIKANDPIAAELLLTGAETTLTPEALTEWQQKIAWAHYQAGNDAACRAIAAKAQSGTGEWSSQADWIMGLASWRQRDYRAAQQAFETVSRRAPDEDMRAAGLYWAARADMALGEPQKVQPRLRIASKMDDTFYGMLAGEMLGIRAARAMDGDRGGADWKRLSSRPNVRAAVALTEIGEYALANDLLRHQARIGSREDHGALLGVASRLSLPETQIWLAHNGPNGAKVANSQHYPAPAWTPDGGWRVDKSLVFAHALQESNFRRDVVSPAGAYGLMQIMPGTAQLIARRKGETYSKARLTEPSTNIEYGQSYLEQMRDFSATEGLLPKVIAAYNAGPGSVKKWNELGIDRADPLLYIESIPFWETRGYVTIVLRNYWMYQRNAGQPAPSLAAMSQGMWPRFPGMSGASAVRMDNSGKIASAD
ncbi:lytic transglycosylase domain-containing protein [Sphingobium boeckii]|uniref:lytic transglycosylase domain-containing protein n=1 Tax=Sphingobium boeckii TaxID=1082345 RepID=UPI00160CB161|nr:lytic transglycosylase domain-containing protein [Sphingobium boeckii]